MVRYLDKVFTYAYTGIPQIMPILFMLSENDAKMVISNKKVVAYDAPDKNHWNWMEVALGMSTIVDIPLGYACEDDKKMLYRLIMLNSDNLLNVIEREVTDKTISVLEKVYHNIYELYLNEVEKKRYLVSLSAMKQSLLKNELALKIWK